MTIPRPRLGLTQGMRQQMLLLPHMLQSIEVLQLSGVELAEYIARAAEENTALRVEDGPLERRAREFPREPRRSAVSGREATERHDELLQNHPERERTLAERVEDQLAMLDLEPELEPWVHVVALALDERGYLAASDEELLALARGRGLASADPAADLGRLGRAIACVQRLEPRGIGGRNAVETLLLQLDPRDPDYTLLCALLEEFLEDVAHNRLPAVARSLGIDVARLRELIGELAELSLRPGAELCETESPPIRPEILIERRPNGEPGFELSIENSGLPTVSIDPQVVRAASDRDQPRELRSYLRGQLADARSIVAAVEQRRRTLSRIAALVFERQKGFLEHGPGHLVPLTMAEVAGELGLAISTISRAVAGKHVQTPWGVFALRHFFQSSAGSQEHAREDVREIVRSLIAAEDPTRPLSDDEIVAVLARRGCGLARRTVAKYRQELGLSSSYRRRRHA